MLSIIYNDVFKVVIIVVLVCTLLTAHLLQDACLRYVVTWHDVMYVISPLTSTQPPVDAHVSCPCGAQVQCPSQVTG